MKEKKNAGNGFETGISAPDAREAKTTSRDNSGSVKGGRPKKSDIHPFVASQVLKLYVSFLRERAPAHWNDRRINFELFSPEIPDAQRTDRAPFNGIGKLADRTVLPTLGLHDRISRGILRAENPEKFPGGLQILFHPYVRMLSKPQKIEEIRAMWTSSDTAKDIGVIQRSAFGYSRNYREFELESSALLKRIKKAKSDPDFWRSNFLDLIAVAIGLTLESWTLGDNGRLRSWRGWWKQNNLRFSDWPVGSELTREVLDRWITLMLEQLDLPYFSPMQAGIEHLTNYVVSGEETGKSANKADGRTEKIDFFAAELIWIFLALRDGKQPEPAEIQKILLLDKSLPQNSSGDISSLIKIRWLQDDPRSH